MIRMQLPGGLEALIDEEDQSLVAGYRWRPLTVKTNHYVHAWQGYQHIYMHRLIIGAPKGRRVDHRDNNGLNNRRSNLRLATAGQNSANRVADNRKRGTTSRFKGVYWTLRSSGKWAACIHIDGKSYGLGYYLTEDEAAAAYDVAAVRAWGPFAKTNAMMFPGR